jgi:iron complex transport system substrate-binding protein
MRLRILNRGFHTALGASIVLAAFLIASMPSCLAAGPPERIVSLAPNVTEILFAMGLGAKVVGVTTFCDYPPGAGEKPKVGGMSNPSLEAVVASEPDIVVMTTDGNPKWFEERLRNLGIRTHVLAARRIYGLPDTIRELGGLLGVAEKAEGLALRIGNALKEYKAGRPRGKKVLFIIWPEPLIVAGPGTGVDDAITLLGYENIAARAGVNYPRYSVEEVIRQMPDYIVIGRAMGYGDAVELSARLRERLMSTPALKEGNVRYMSDRLYRLGPRVIDGIRELSELLGESK